MTSYQTFAVYIDQENIPWPSVDMTVKTTDNDQFDGNLACLEDTFDLPYQPKKYSLIHEAYGFKYNAVDYWFVA